jgi:hypothetical protein
VSTVARRSTKKIEYPAYGESPHGRREVAPEPRLVKNSNGR